MDHVWTMWVIKPDILAQFSHILIEAYRNQTFQSLRWPSSPWSLASSPRSSCSALELGAPKHWEMDVSLKGKPWEHPLDPSSHHMFNSISDWNGLLRILPHFQTHPNCVFLLVVVLSSPDSAKGLGLAIDFLRCSSNSHLGDLMGFNQQDWDIRYYEDMRILWDFI